MKTPEQWWVDLSFLLEHGMKERTNWINMIRAIQKDAVEEGRRRCFWELDRIQAKENAAKPNP